MVTRRGFVCICKCPDRAPGIRGLYASPHRESTHAIALGIVAVFVHMNQQRERGTAWFPGEVSENMSS